MKKIVISLCLFFAGLGAVGAQQTKVVVVPLGEDVAKVAGTDKQIQFNNSGEVGGAERFFYSPNPGRVGINKNNPSAMLDIADDGTTARTLNILASGDSSQTVNIQRSSSFGFAGNDLLQLVLPDVTGGGQFIEAESLGNVRFRVDADGDVRSDGTITGGGADYADLILISSGLHSVEPGDVLIIDKTNPRAVVKSNSARSTLVAGVYSTRPGFIGSEEDLDQTPQLAQVAKFADRDTSNAPTDTLAMAAMVEQIPLALVGIVPTKVSAENGAIQPGDLLVTSTRAGHAMRDGNPKVGTVIGKALGSLNEETGIIPVLISLQ